MNAVRMRGSDQRTLLALSNFFVEPHIFPMLDGRVKTFLGAHLLFSRIESGAVRVYGAFAGAFLLGCCFGALDDERVSFSVHVVCPRKIDAVAVCSACEKAMIADYRKDGVEVNYVVGYIPDYNRAAIRMAKRYGCSDFGIRNDKTIYHNRTEVPCREMRKAVG